MRILLYGINYFPEEVGIAKYSTEMCEWLAAHGHQVEVITAMPSYPFWRIMDQYRGRGWHSEVVNNVVVRHCPVYVPRVVTGMSRIAYELSFAISSGVYWAYRMFRRYDVIICVCPPLQTALPAVVHRLFNRSLLIYHVQDLQMDAAKDLGLIKNKTVLKLVSWFEKFLMRKSDRVSTISEGMKRRILLKGISADKMLMLPNWTDTTKFRPFTPPADVRASFGIDGSKSIVLYSGNIGAKQGLEILVDVAQSLQESHKHIQFLIIGDGAFRDELMAMIEQRSLANVKLVPLQPAERVPAILNMAQLHLVLQKKAAADLVMPSKLTSILAVGGVAIVTAEEGTGLYQVIADNDMGILVEPESPDHLREAILSALNDDLGRLRSNARRYAEEYLERDAVMEKFQTHLLSNIQRSGDSAR